MHFKELSLSFVCMKNVAFNETCVKYHYILVGNLHLVIPLGGSPVFNCTIRVY